ncbi:MAG: preprotein translocase subunit SecG [Candidatus Portnoybacteria bacterium CG_4_9_14_3_um_filter_40_10]|uniref:Protein-export membrane protein SecG n=1 Tax=Candidatus Portnoybacteria bacterium CG_4_9_14_3_um_filter_40_10 TaxID=1974804 RepID=A0A2M7YPB5_9BACT|nr:MAG: preprotein translocase subunit SecG [Candidatus Portnoybacteria bacterium CG_4_9_14_3_um_filter_40_10]
MPRFHLHKRSEGWRRTNVLRLNKFGKDHFKLKSFLNIWKVKKYPSWPQFRHFFKILTKKEKITFFVFLLLFAASFFSLLLSLYFKNTEIQPSPGGVFVEGVIGQPRFINPVYSMVSDVDQDLVELIFSGLLKYDENLKIVPDLAKNYEIKDGGKVYEVCLKDNLFWSDGKPLTVNDVIFTIKTIQNSDYKSPQIANWIGVEIEKISEQGIRFSLKNPYDSFLENLTQKIIPEHVWEDVGSQNFPLKSLTTRQNLRLLNNRASIYGSYGSEGKEKNFVHLHASLTLAFMNNLLPILQIIIASLLVVFILLQQRGQGLGSAFGQSGGFYSTRRGIQQKIFWATIVSGALFIILALLNLIL